MFGGGNGLSLADIAAVTRGNNDGDGGFGGNNGWWILIILFALFGWGRGGYGESAGNNGGGGSQVVYPIGADIQRGFDNSAVISKLDGISNGICSLGYDQLSQMNNISSQIQSCCCGVENQIQQANFNNVQATNAIGTQLQQCCCDLKSLFAEANYNRATDTCAITTAIDRLGDRVIANDNNNYRSLYDQQVALQMDALRQQNATLQRQLNTCDTQNMINASASYIVNTLQPTPNPAYIVPNPLTGSYFGARTGCCNNTGWNNSCCGNGWTNGF